MYYWNSPALAQMASKTCFILNKKESALQWMQYENKTWVLWVRYCSFSSRYCPQWDDSYRQSEKNVTLGSWHWRQSCFKDLLWGIFFLWRSAPSLSVDGTGDEQNTQIPGLVSMQGSAVCLSWLKLPSTCWFPAVERGPWLVLHWGFQGCEKEVCSRTSPFSLQMNLPPYKNTNTIFPNSGFREIRVTTKANEGGGKILG